MDRAGCSMGFILTMSVNVSIIIINYNTSKLLKECIASIFNKTKRITFEIIVADNNSSDDSVLMMKDEYPDVVLLEKNENVGFGRANNEASLIASGKYLFFLNSDTYLCNDAISILFDFMELNQECGICGANLKDFEGNPIHSFDRHFPGVFSDIFLLLRKLPRLLYGQNWCYNYTGVPMEVAYITGADLLIRKNLFMIVNGFDSFFFMYYEETELTVRIKKMNYKIYNIPDALIAHKKGASLQYSEGINEVFYRSKYYYIKKIWGLYHSYITHIVFMIVCYLKILSLRLRNKTELWKKYSNILSIEGTVFNELKIQISKKQTTEKIS